MIEHNVIRKVLLIEQIERNEKLKNLRQTQRNNPNWIIVLVSIYKLNKNIEPTNGCATRSELIQSIKDYPNCQIIKEKKEFKIDLRVQDKSQFHLKMFGVSLTKSFPNCPPQLVLQPVIDVPWIKETGAIIYDKVGKKWKADSTHLTEICGEKSITKKSVNNFYFYLNKCLFQHLRSFFFGVNKCTQISKCDNGHQQETISIKVDLREEKKSNEAQVSTEKFPLGSSFVHASDKHIFPMSYPCTYYCYYFFLSDKLMKKQKFRWYKPGGSEQREIVFIEQRDPIVEGKETEGSLIIKTIEGKYLYFPSETEEFMPMVRFHNSLFFFIFIVVAVKIEPFFFN
ncbi:hypothetical protein RFI_34155 [Reticulomyxa filosa]|uniref:Uncharacterized protein n=1 Tax=Reticulomyxa filosa TaxID=46433 RepID=X6LQ38_RETFI|nr:hypothetical protein RFI_34155 [Reticulomyxa filosa]|eukprot:ETO03257.1 hypothetical protein RFI_34155 [Reticulomyxa filosa]